MTCDFAILFTSLTDFLKFPNIIVCRKNNQEIKQMIFGIPHMEREGHTDTVRASGKTQDFI